MHHDTADVGLGMKGAKVGDVEEAEKGSADGYEDVVRKTKERAKERGGACGQC
jgi:RNA-binding protein 5/10